MDVNIYSIFTLLIVNFICFCFILYTLLSETGVVKMAHHKSITFQSKIKYETLEEVPLENDYNHDKASNTRRVIRPLENKKETGCTQYSMLVCVLRQFAAL